MKQRINLAVLGLILALPIHAPAQDRLSASLVLSAGKAPAFTANYELVTLRNVLGTKQSLTLTSFAGVSDRALVGFGFTHPFKAADNAVVTLGLGWTAEAGRKSKPALMIGWSLSQ